MTDAEKELRQSALLSTTSAVERPTSGVPLSDMSPWGLADIVLDVLDRIEALEKFARKGIHAYHHGHVCPSAHGSRSENPAECENSICREWAKVVSPP